MKFLPITMFRDDTFLNISPRAIFEVKVQWTNNQRGLPAHNLNKLQQAHYGHTQIRKSA